MIAPRSNRTSEGHGPPRSFFQYLDILRDRWLSASLAFLVVAGLVGAQALFARPSFESRAMIQLETGRMASDPLADVTLADPQANVDAELEVMGSFSVAERAAVLAGAGVIIQQEHAYRPWESLMRDYGEGAEPARLSARVIGKPMPEKSGRFDVTFDAEGQSFTVKVPEGAEAWGPFEYKPDVGAQIEVLGEQIRLEPIEDSPPPAGRRFVLRLQTKGQAAAFVRGMAFAEQVGTWTGIVHLGARSNDPHLAKRVADALTESYLELKQDWKDRQIRNRIEWLEKALASQKNILHKAEDLRDAYL
ncbi:MAG: hypothetical protein QNJ90_14970, partial [Planctomycetota bacterium]|nr:hypothetical protein [Planctomycetota bacterium]